MIIFLCISIEYVRPTQFCAAHLCSGHVFAQLSCLPRTYAWLMQSNGSLTKNFTVQITGFWALRRSRISWKRWSKDVPRQFAGSRNEKSKSPSSQADAPLKFMTSSGFFFQIFWTDYQRHVVDSVGAARPPGGCRCVVHAVPCLSHCPPLAWRAYNVRWCPSSCVPRGPLYNVHFTVPIRGQPASLRSGVDFCCAR